MKKLMNSIIIAVAILLAYPATSHPKKKHKLGIIVLQLTPGELLCVNPKSRTIYKVIFKEAKRVWSYKYKKAYWIITFMNGKKQAVDFLCTVRRKT